MSGQTRGGAAGRAREAADLTAGGRLIHAVRPVLDASFGRAIAALLPGQRTASPPDWSARPHRVLFVRYERIGDMIMATPLIRAIAMSHPTIILDVLASRVNAPVLEGNRHVNRVLKLGSRTPAGYARLLREVGATGYDVVVDGRINSPRVFLTTPLVMLASGARYRIGWCDPTESMTRRVYNLCTAGTYVEAGGVHYIDASARLAEPFGVYAADVDWRPELFVSTAERAAAESAWAGAGAPASPRLLVNLSAPGRGRRWPDERFVAVISAAKSHRPELAVGIIGLPAERASVRAVAQAAGATAIVTPGVRDALAIVATADMVFTPDTSIAHAAAAFRKPAVVMLRRDAASYQPYGNRGRTILWDGEDIERLAVADVRDAVLVLTTGSSER